MQSKGNAPVQAQAIPLAPSVAFGDENDEDEFSRDIAKKHRHEHHVLPKSSLKAVAIDENDAIYDYDGVYDAMKSGDREAVEAKALDKKERKPKYMQNLFEAAEIRKVDRLRAEGVKLKREREAEGDEFADKETFVTEAYRAQREEMKRVEEEQVKAEATIRSQGGGFAAFTQSLLNESLAKQDTIVKASLEATASGLNDKDLDQRERIRKDIERAEARKVESSQDRRSPNDLAPKKQVGISQKEREDRKAQIERQRRMLETQLKDVDRQEAADELRRQEAIRAQAKRQKTQVDVSSARERYLARKKAEAATAELPGTHTS